MGRCRGAGGDAYPGKCEGEEVVVIEGGGRLSGGVVWGGVSEC